MVAELCRALPRIDSIADWEAVVPEVLDVSFGELLDDYETYYPLCTSDQLRARLWGCAGTPDFVLVSDDPQRRRYMLETGCDDPRTTNAASSDEGGAATTRLVYVPEDNWFTIVARAKGPSEEPARFTVQQCTSCYHQPVTIRSGDPGWLNVENAHYVEAGFYEVTLFFDPRDRAELEIIVGFPY